MAENVEKLVTDAAFAEELRMATKEPLEKLCEIINRAKARGVIVNFNLAPDQYGRHRIADLSIVKVL